MAPEPVASLASLPTPRHSSKTKYPHEVPDVPTEGHRALQSLRILPAQGS